MEIGSIEECTLAARTLGLWLPSITAEDDKLSDPAHPSGCYVEKGKLKMNLHEANKGRCSVESQCLCKVPLTREEGQHLFVDNRNNAGRLRSKSCRFCSTLTATGVSIVVKNTKAEFEKCHVASQNGGTLLRTQGLLEVTFTQSSVAFTNTASLQLENEVVRLLKNSFTGDGSIKLGVGNELQGLKQAELAANEFDGVKLRFGDIRHSNIQLSTT